MESFHKDSDIVNIICVSSYFDLALLWVTFWQYEPQLSFFVLMDQGDKISWAETTQYVHCTVSVLSWAVSYKQSRGASRNPRQLTVLVDNLRTHLKMHSGEKLNLIQTMQEHFSKPSSPNCPLLAPFCLPLGWTVFKAAITIWWPAGTQFVHPKRGIWKKEKPTTIRLAWAQIKTSSVVTETC